MGKHYQLMISFQAFQTQFDAKGAVCYFWPRLFNERINKVLCKRRDAVHVQSGVRASSWHTILHVTRHSWLTRLFHAKQRMVIESTEFGGKQSDEIGPQ